MIGATSNGKLTEVLPVITIVGTGHVFDLSDKIYRLIHKIRPDLVAVELDRSRLGMLQMERRNREKGIETPVSIGMLLKPSPIPFRFRIIGYIQKKLAAANNVFPGEEMLTGVEAGRSIGAKIALIDRDINKTLYSLNKAMTSREKLRFYFALFAGFTGLGGGKKETIHSQIERISNDYDSVIEEIGKQFPGLKRALIDERDLNMAYALTRLNDTYPTIIVFVGEAHVTGMKRLLEKKGIHPDIIHLSSFMNDAVPQASHSINVSVH
jgi:pheromone shutdown protein TraB